MSFGSSQEAEAHRQRAEKALDACELYYVQHVPQKEIAKRLKVSPASVSRLLLYARESGLVRISVCPPRNLELALRLRRLLTDHGIRDIVVSGTERKHVSCAAAAYFEQHGASGDTVVLDGGKTMGEFVDVFPTGIFSAMTLVPICADPTGYDVSACELVARLSTKFSHPARQSIPQYTGRQRLDEIQSKVAAIARGAGFVFLGTGPWRPNFTAMEFVEYLGLDPETLRQQHPGVIALCGYCAMDRHGRYVPIRDLDERMPRSLEFEDMRALARSENCHAVLLAHSKEKCEAVLTVLKGRLCNTLILDEGLANALAEAAENDAEWRSKQPP